MVSITEEKFLASPKETLAHVHSHHEVLNVVSANGGYVIVDSDEWRNICETLYINNIKGLNESIVAPSREPLEDAIPLEELDW